MDRNISDCREIHLATDPPLTGLLGVPDNPLGLVIFAHGSGSGRFSPRNNYVARRLRDAGFATLLIDLLDRQEELDRRNVFDIALLASRLVKATDWAAKFPETAALKPAYFGASTGAGAALQAAAGDRRITAIVSRGGRPDLAGDEALAAVTAPTLLLVGGLDAPVITLNQAAAGALTCLHKLVIVPGASHLFEEPGTLEQVVDLAADWFRTYAGGRR
ncbi:alpha/beta hydrolase [Altererythrobacter confluentis]|uniref:Alpha/beta hydrolase n=1 Tax=Allopontixanthobacter confluentis TaxID=1849021 RepID=A0A6L7GB95_9SPHN|nr:dienelactone hydrolase family protein [Allopontixanthobacter confluentis]MXP13223.1 alpha/beta hydrolase [Allopontixanthobacter confluentis]